MSYEFAVYIDEAGDDGIGKLRDVQRSGQSLWFTVGACCVRRENDQRLVEWRDEIANAFPMRRKRDLHFKHLKHEQRRYACRVLAGKPVRVAVVMSNKVTLLNLNKTRLETFKRKNHLHNYVCRWLLERVSLGLKTYAEERSMPNCRAKIVFSRRGGMNYDEFCEYLQLIKDGKEVMYSPGRIDWDVIDPERIEVADHERRAGLQLADICTSAMFKAVEPSGFGFYEQAYADELRSVVLRNGDKLPPYNCGITHIPRLETNPPLTKEQRMFFESWKK